MPPSERTVGTKTVDTLLIDGTKKPVAHFSLTFFYESLCNKCHKLHVMIASLNELHCLELHAKCPSKTGYQKSRKIPRKENQNMKKFSQWLKIECLVECVGGWVDYEVGEAFCKTEIIRKSPSIHMTPLDVH